MALRQTLNEVTKAQDSVASGQWSVGIFEKKSALDERLFLSANDRHCPLFSAGMSLALPGEQIVGPDILVGWCDWGGGGIRTGGAIPIGGRVGNAPDVSRIVKRHSDKEELAVIAQRQAIGHAGRSASAAWQSAQQHWRFEWQRLRSAESAALRAHNEGDT
jgi:hypothetical protein